MNNATVNNASTSRQPDRDTLRPRSLDEFRGQPELSKNLSMILRAAKDRNETPDHMLFAGPPGLGKTTLANIVAHETGLPLITTSGPALEQPKDAASLLSGLTTPSVVFIDEIHRLGRVVEEVLYPALEDGVLDFLVGQGPKARTVRLTLPPFVMVGATTQLGLLSGPLRDRFGFSARLKLYQTEDLTRIVERSARVLGCDTTPEGSRVVAGRSRGTPRVANALLRRTRDYAQVSGIDLIDQQVAEQALDQFGIDKLGLDELALELLRALCDKFGGGPVGLSTLAASLGEATTTIEEVYEPYLMWSGLLARTPRGRVATTGAWRHLGLDAPATTTQPNLFDQDGDTPATDGDADDLPPA